MDTRADVGASTPVSSRYCALALTSLSSLSKTAIDSGMASNRTSNRTPARPAWAKSTPLESVIARSRSVICNETSTALIREERITPLDQYADPVAETGQVHDVDEQPCPPRQPAAKMPPGNDSDGAIATDGGQITLVHVPEALPSLSPDA